MKTGLPLAAVALALLAACSSFDATLLQDGPDTPSAQPDASAEAGGDAGSPDKMDGGDPAQDAAIADAAPGTDAASDPPATPDADGGSDDDAGVTGPPPQDLCPDDPLKLAPGSCGCGASEDDADACQALAGALRHRYRFDAPGTTATDIVSGADATIVGTTLDGAALTLAGGTSDQYAQLPAGTLSALTDVTIEVWLEWQGGDIWQRIFDFGTSDGGAGAQGSGTTYLFLTPESSAGTMRLAFSLDGFANESIVDASGPLPTGGVHHVAVVFEDQTRMHLYLDGALEGSVDLASGDSLSAITDDNVWIGRSQYTSDPELAATVHELRIHAAALTDTQVAASARLGPDPPFLP